MTDGTILLLCINHVIMKSQDTSALISLIFGIALIGITFNPGLRESLNLTRIPNPFQKNISKSVNVLESITNNSGMGMMVEWFTPNCQSISINRQRFDELLSSGVKVTTANEWRTPIPKLDTGHFVANLNSYDDKCVGQSYILEGPENLLNKL